MAAIQLLDEEQTSARTGISRRTLQRWRVTGEGPRWVRMGLRRIAYSEADLAAWLAGRTYSSRAAEYAAGLAA